MASTSSRFGVLVWVVILVVLHWIFHVYQVYIAALRQYPSHCRYAPGAGLSEDGSGRHCTRENPDAMREGHGRPGSPTPDPKRSVPLAVTLFE
jgi:hypothetical protein